MTPAVRALEAAGVTFSILQYDHDPAAPAYGAEAATALGLDPQQVFKTLVVSCGGAGLAVAVVAVADQLSMREVAVALGVKRVELAAAADAERATGYVVGGISPFGQRRRLPTVVDETCVLFDVVYVSGGRRGLEVAIAPDDLVRLLDATVAPISA